MELEEADELVQSSLELLARSLQLLITRVLLPAQVEQLEMEAKGKAKLMIRVRGYKGELKIMRSRVVSIVVTGFQASGWRMQFSRKAGRRRLSNRRGAPTTTAVSSALDTGRLN
jgi:hypothetical protein